MKTNEWFVLEETPARTIEIRAWSPGDGLSCSNRTVRSKVYKVVGITTEADKEAREAVLAAHWNEYQEELARRVKEKKEAQLSKLPESLRESFVKAAEASSDD